MDTVTSKTKWAWIAVAALLAALIALPAMAWAEDNPASNPLLRTAALPEGAPEIPEELRPLWEQLAALRAEHAELSDSLMDQLDANRNLMQQIREKARGTAAEDLRALVEQFQAFREEDLRPLRTQAGDMRRALANARRERDQEALQAARTGLVGLLGQWKEAAEQAQVMAGRIREARQAALPVREAVRECREQLAPLHEQSRLIRLEVAKLNLQREEAAERLRSALKSGDLDLDAAEDALMDVIGLKEQLMAHTEDLLDLARQAGAILEETLEAL